jgi:hypothetical protein
VSAVLFDRPAVVAQARQQLPGQRCELVGGDFFESVPPADTYVLCRVLHDWDDQDAVRILSACRGSVTPGGRLVVVDAVLPRLARDQPAAIRMDLHMLILLGSRDAPTWSSRTS